MKKILVLMVCTILVVSVIFSGCALTDEYTDTADYENKLTGDFIEAEESVAYDGGGEIYEESIEEYATDEPAELYDVESSSSDITDTKDGVDVKSEPKLVYTMNASLETYNFDDDYELIKSETEKADGFIEYENLTSPSADQPYKSGRYLDMTIRIPVENYDDFTKIVENTAYVQNKSSNVTNISDTYYDVDSRIELLEERKERLYGHLEEATKMEDKIAIENEISDVIYQLDDLKSQQRGMDKSVEYATVNVSMTELLLADGMSSSSAYNPGDSFARAFISLGNFITDQVLWLAEAAPVLIIIAVVLIILIVVLGKVLKDNPAVSKGQWKCSFVLGILSVIFGVVFSLAGLVLGIIAFVKGFKNAKDNKLALVSYILGLVGIAISIILIIIGISSGLY